MRLEAAARWALTLTYLPRHVRLPYGHPVSKIKDPAEDRAVFVDEVACIGCKQCIYIAAATFRMEAEHGRSRVFAQWADTEADIKAAIDSCPVSCIHWVKRSQLPALEHVTRNICERVNVSPRGGKPGQRGEAAPTAAAPFRSA